MKKTSTEYINDNDFEGAKERFDSSNRRWKDYWFETCLTIAENCKEWAEKYIIDPIKRTIEKIVQTITANDNKQSCVYLIKMFDSSGRYVFLKGGKTDNLLLRMKQLSSTVYSRSNTIIRNVEIIKVWELPSSHLAECFEQALHHYLASFLTHIPNDRYSPTELTDEHFVELNRRYEIIKGFA
jgi:hypothetical protein